MKFDQACDSAKTIKISDNQTKLKLYALFKQAKEGDNKTSEPSRFKMVDHAKWKAWMDVKGKSAEDAQKEYIALVQGLL